MAVETLDGARKWLSTTQATVSLVLETMNAINEAGLKHRVHHKAGQQREALADASLVVPLQEQLQAAVDELKQLTGVDSLDDAVMRSLDVSAGMDMAMMLFATWRKAVVEVKSLRAQAVLDDIQEVEDLAAELERRYRAQLSYVFSTVPDVG